MVKNSIILDVKNWSYYRKYADRMLELHFNGPIYCRCTESHVFIEKLEIWKSNIKYVKLWTSKICFIHPENREIYKMKENAKIPDTYFCSAFLSPSANM